MDLGNIIASLGTEYIRNRYAMPPVQTSPVLFPDIGSFLTGGDASTTTTQPPQRCGYLWNPDTQKWVKKSRRRRKRLATQSDLKDLAALKGILGSGEAFKVWIATHGR